MIRQQLAKLLAVILIVSCTIGSVEMTAFAAAADSLSTDIVMPENGEETVGASEEKAEADRQDREEENASEEAEEKAEETGQTGQEAAPGEGEDLSGGAQESAADPETAGNAQSGSEAESAVTAEGEGNGENEENAGSGEAGEAPGTEGAEQAESAEAPAQEAVDEAPEEAAGGRKEQENGPDAEDAGKDLSEKVPEGSTEEKGKEAAKEAVAETEKSLSLSSDKISLYVGKTAKLKAVVSFTAGSMEEAEKLAEEISWGSDRTGTVKVKAVGKAVLSAQEIASGESAPGSEAETGASDSEASSQTDGGGEKTPAAVTGTISQEVTVSAVAEGTARITASIGGEKKSCTVTAKPVPVALGKAKSLRWVSTTTLKWEAVKNANKYKVTVSLVNGSKTYSKTVTVTGKSYVDLEGQINALIKANKAALSGAAYTVTASVTAIATDTVHYKNGAAAKAPSLRYLRVNFQESVKRNGWFMKGGKWYLYEAGVKKTGWIWFLGKKYYLGDDGVMRTNCWVGKKYLKASGEMAKDEWVDGYRYYVDANGNKVAGKVFSLKRWVKTANGWRYKRVNGTYAKNEWLTIAGRTYYFDQKGYMKTGWVTQDGKKYFLNRSGSIASGLGVRCTGWKKVGSFEYWFDDAGVMAKDSWVDRGQYYVGVTGHKLSWITYANLRNVNTSNRLGYYVYGNGTPPEHSIAGYDLSYEKGNRIMVVDLLFTKDNIPVCFHDNEVKYARNKDGSRPSSAPVVSRMTLAQLREYDYGISMGEAYKGTPPLTMEEMVKWIRKHADTEMYIEVKTSSMNATQIKKVTALLSKYKITDRSSMIFNVTGASDTRAQRVHKAAPTLRIGFMTMNIGANVYSQIAKAQGTSNEVFLWCWPNTKLTTSIVQTLRNKNVLFEFGTLDTFGEIIKYYSKGTAYSYTSGIETDGAVFRDLLGAATFHEPARWETVGASYKYRQIDGTYARSKWLTIGGKKYHFNSRGNMQTGWLAISGKWYYLDSKGAMVTGTRTIAGKKYKFGTDGAMIQ